MAHTVTTDLVVAGDLVVDGLSALLPKLCVANDNIASVERSQFLATTVKQVVNWRDFASWSSFPSSLPSSVTKSTDDANDFTIVGGTFGTETPCLETDDVSGVGSVKYLSLFYASLPHSYVSGSDITLCMSCGMKSAGASEGASVSMNAFRSNGESGHLAFGKDGVGGESEFVNNARVRTVKQVIDETNVAPGTQLLGVVRAFISDEMSSGGSDVRLRVYKVWLEFESRL